MKKLYLLLGILLTLALFALPAMAATDTDSVTVTVTIGDLYQISATGNLSTTITGDDLDAGFDWNADVTTLDIDDNSTGWSVSAQLATVPTEYDIYIDDDSAGSGGDTTGMTQLTGGDDALTLNGEGNAGSSTYGIDYLITGLDWTDTEDLSGVNLTFTLTT